MNKLTNDIRITNWMKACASFLWCAPFVISLALSGCVESEEPTTPENEETDMFFEVMPDEVFDALEQRDLVIENINRFMEKESWPFKTDLLELETRPRYFAVTESVGWRKAPWGSRPTLRVAFLGIDTKLHAEIVDAANTFAENSGVSLDFGFDPQSKTFRTWSLTDTTRTAEIRISFDMPHHFSLIGTQSVQEDLVDPTQMYGGRAHQRSMNFASFALPLKSGWKRIVRHEFMHALGFFHEHVHPQRECYKELRWNDDSGYQPKCDSDGRYVENDGKNPGLYTYLSGYPHRITSRDVVDKNFGKLNVKRPIYWSDFDPDSIMMYSIPNKFFITRSTDCFSIQFSDEFSDGDRAALLRLYPTDEQESLDALEEQRFLEDTIREFTQFSNDLDMTIRAIGK